MLILAYFILFILSFILSSLGAPTWSLVLLFILFALSHLIKQFYPILFEKNVNKILAFLQKSKHKQYQFTYHFMQGEIDEAEKTLKQIKPQSLQTISAIMLLAKQKQYNEAKNLLPNLKDNEFKWYYGAMLSLKLKELEPYKDYKARVKNPINRSWLEMEELLSDGKKSEVLVLLDRQIETLRGLKLLSAHAYRQEITQEAD